MKSSHKKIVILGQKDALLRSVLELGHLQRVHRLEVLVILPGQPGPNDTHTKGIPTACEAFGFPYLEDASDETIFDRVQAFAPQLLVSVLWPRRIQNDVLGLCADCVNIHPSLLPRHRGSMTQFWTIFEGDNEGGCTLHRMVYKFDAGKILHKVAVPVSSDETALSLNRKLATAIEQCFQHLMRLFLEGPMPVGDEWSLEGLPYRPRRLFRSGVIDPAWPDDQIDRFIRGMYFPPLKGAVALDAHGREHSVNTFEEYKSLRETVELSGEVSQRPASAATLRSANGSASTSHSRHRWRFLAGAILPVLVGIGWSCSRLSDLWRTYFIANAAGSNVAVRHTLAGHPTARCLDGSPYSYYYANGAKGETRWLLYFQGGGWCAEDETLVNLKGYSPDEEAAHPDLCSVRAMGYHGSSKDERSTRDFSGKGFLSGNPLENAVTASWHRVLIRNCDGTLFLSSTNVVGKDGEELHMRGRDNTLAALDSLISEHGMAQATEVIASGCSAGGVASVLLVDWLREHLESRLRHPIFVAALSDSGVFPLWQENDEARPGDVRTEEILEFKQFSWIYAHANVTEILPRQCLEAGLSWKCLHVTHALPYVTTPVFVLQSSIDSWQISDALDPAGLAALSQRIQRDAANSLRSASSRGNVTHGMAVDSCFHHCYEWGHIRWGGVSNAEAFSRWYGQRKLEWAARQQSGSAKTSNTLYENRSEGQSEGWPLMHVDETGTGSGCNVDHETSHRAWHKQLQRAT